MQENCQGYPARSITRRSESHEAASDKKKRHPIGCLFLVRVKGLEPLAYWVVASHSIQLSYTRK